MMTVVLGGAASGKSKYAESLIPRSAAEPAIYIATAQGFDTEMKEKISDHKASRGPHWKTREHPLDVPEALKETIHEKNVLLDCATLWLSNLLLAGADLEARSKDLLSACRTFGGHLVVVSNETGMGIVPETKLGRQFRNAQGRLNQDLAEAADKVVLVTAGLPMVLK